jgi:hypothetical protein
MRLPLSRRHEVVSVDFDDQSWFFRFSENEWLRAGCLWRLLRNGRISLTSNDHGQLFGLTQPIDAVLLAAASFAGKEVTAMGWDDETADFGISLDDDLILQLLPDSSGYEAWELHFEGKHYIAAGGGSVI